MLYTWIYTICNHLGLAFSLSKIIWRVLQVIVYHWLFFLFLSSIPLDRCTTVCLAFHLLKDISVSCFQVLCTTNTSAKNAHVQVFVWIRIFISLELMPWSEIPGLYDICMFSVFTKLSSYFPQYHFLISFWSFLLLLFVLYFWVLWVFYGL